MRVPIVILLSCAVIIAPASGFAYKVGDVDLKVSAGVTEGHDDNITRSKYNLKSDSITTVSVGLSAFYEGKLQSLSVSGNIWQNIYRRYSGYDYTAENLSAVYNRELSRYDRVTVRDEFTHSEDPTSFEDEFGRTAGRYSYYTNTFGVDYTHDVTSQLSLIGRFSNYGYWPSRSDLSDSFQNQIGVEADYAVSSRTITYATYDHVRRDFYPGGESSFNMFGAGVRQYITKQLFADLRTGINFINAYNERSFAKPYYSLTLTDDLDETSRASLTVAKQYTTNNSTSDLFDQWQASGSFRKQIFERLAGQANAFYGQGEYSNLRIDDNFVGASVQFDYAILHNTKANVQYSYSATNSNLDDRDYIRKYVGGGIKVEF